jgi:hypothetical protein
VLRVASVVLAGWHTPKRAKKAHKMNIEIGVMEPILLRYKKYPIPHATNPNVTAKKTENRFLFLPKDTSMF